ncbi:hypothetical protein Hanom_Chr00s047275g01777781 [Helianthus anomalus]
MVPLHRHKIPPRIMYASSPPSIFSSFFSKTFAIKSNVTIKQLVHYNRKRIDQSISIFSRFLSFFICSFKREEKNI